MYVCLLGPRNCGGDKADSRRGGSMAAQLSPDMPQPAMDQFLAAAFGVQTNPFSVKDIFESRKDAVAWGLLQRTLKLDAPRALARGTVPRPSCSREPAPTTPRQLPPTPTVWPGTHSFPGLREAPSSHASSAAPAAAARRRRPEGGGGCGGQEAAARCAATAVAAAAAVAATAAATVVAAAMASAAVRRWWQR